MANRCYLYATDRHPGQGSVRGRSLVGLSEWSSRVPLAYKILLSGNPEKCISSIWEDEESALVGDYDVGTSRLFEFMERLTVPDAAPLRDEAREFLSAQGNRRRYLVLECGEILWLDSRPVAEQMDALLAEVLNLDSEIDAAVARVNGLARVRPEALGVLGTLRRIIWGGPLYRSEPVSPLDELGLGNWENVLFYDFQADGDGA